MQCEPQLAERHAVEMLINNIHGPIEPLLRGFDIVTFQMLIDKVIKLLPVLSDTINSPKETKGKERQQQHKSQKPQGIKQEVHVARVVGQRGKQVAVAAPSPTSTEPRFKNSSFEEKFTKKYSFSKESTKKIFLSMVKAGMNLPEPRRPHEMGLIDDPLFCLYHRCLGHTIENCYIFKDLVERKYKDGDITLSKKYLLPKASVHMISHSTLQMPQPIHEAHIFMVDHVSDYDMKATSLQSGEDHNDDDRNAPQNWRQIIKEKDEEIALLKAQIKGLGDIIHELISRNEELKVAMSPMSTEVIPKKAIMKKEKSIATIEDTSKPARLAKYKESSKFTNRQESFQEKKNKRYSFRKEAAGFLFYEMLKKGLHLPEPKRSKEIHEVNSPNYCPYHRCLGHNIEDCFVFKNLLEEKYQQGVMHISEQYLLPGAVIINPLLQIQPPTLKVELVPTKITTNTQSIKASLKAVHPSHGIPVGMYISDSGSSEDEKIIYKPPAIISSSSGVCSSLNEKEVQTYH